MSNANIFGRFHCVKKVENTAYEFQSAQVLRARRLLSYKGHVKVSFIGKAGNEITPQDPEI